MISTVTAVIGGIIIFLGALGLLNVAIVTSVSVREIGIRRAVGPRADGVSVFMESVVATFAAGASSASRW